jgi:glycosyltransferase involved in cell wall biosynthesis
VERYVGKCLDSILKQSFTVFEVICINDCSTDGTLDILRRYEQRDSRVRIIDLQQNGGLANGRRVGWKHANGDYIVFVDSDDWVEPDYLKCLYEARDDHDIVMFSGWTKQYNWLSIKGDCAPQHLIEQKIIKGEELNKCAIGFFGVTQLPGTACGKLYSRDLFSDEIPVINIFFQEDVLLNMYLFERVKSISIVPGYKYHYRQHSGGTSRISQRYINDFRELYSIKKQYIASWNYGHNALDYTKIELKNCFYDYIKRLIWRGDSEEQVLTEIEHELTHECYADCCNLSDVFQHLLAAEDYSALAHRDVKAIYAVALAMARRGRLRRWLRKLL